MSKLEGNPFILSAIISMKMRQKGMGDKVEEMVGRLCDSKSDEEALSILSEYNEGVGE